MFEHTTPGMYLTPPCDYHLFKELKKCFSGQHFADDTELITFINSFLQKTTSEFYNHSICKHILCYKKCLDLKKLCRKIVNLNIFQNTRLKFDWVLFSLKWNGYYSLNESRIWVFNFCWKNLLKASSGTSSARYFCIHTTKILESEYKALGCQEPKVTALDGLPRI